MYRCESWTIKKAEHWRIDTFELWCQRILLRVPWTARRSNQSTLKEISPECSLEGLMLKLKLQLLATWCEELTHLKRPWCWERLKAGGEGDDRGRDGWMASPTQGTWVWVNSQSWWWTGRPGMLWFMGSQRVRHDGAAELNWTEIMASINTIGRKLVIYLELQKNTLFNELHTCRRGCKWERIALVLCHSNWQEGYNYLVHKMTLDLRIFSV